MKKATILVAMLFVTAASAFAGDVLVDPALKNFANGPATKFVSVAITLNEPASNAAKPYRYSKADVTAYLKGRTGTSMKIFRQELGTSVNQNVFVRGAHWINNTVFASINPQGLRDLTRVSNVYKIYVNGAIKKETPVYAQLNLPINGNEAIPYDYVDMGLDKLIKELPEVTGKGVLLGSVDTGVDGGHPALQGKIKLFLDAANKKIVAPFDSDTHGTHTCGTMVGGNRTDNFIGMAPGANLVAAGALSDYDSMLYAMEWMLNPDGNNQTTNDSPKAVNCSWHTGGAPDQELFYKAVEAWEAAGILPVFSAGNAGPSDGTITHPKEHPLAFATAATGKNGRATNYSSRGPATYHGQKTEKPDLAAPGDEIISSLPGGRYGEMSGTSMASPHVTGSTALILQVAPNLNPQQIRTAFLTTLKPMADESGSNDTNYPTEGIPAWNKVYGHGKLDIYAAVKAAKGAFTRVSGYKMSDLMETIGFTSTEDLQSKFIAAQDTQTEFDPDKGFKVSDEGHWLTASELFN